MSANDGDEKLGWMYKNSNEVVDREEYLFGRRLDKNLESESNRTETESIPGSIFSLPELSNKVDALRKIKEDPLEAIKEKEREMRKELLKNPIQMKKLQQMYEAQRRQTDNIKNKEKKKKKKSKDEDKFADDSALDALLSKKLAKLIKTYGKDKVFNSSDSTSSSQKKDKHKKGKKSKQDTSSSSSSESSEGSSDDYDSDKKKPRNALSDKKSVKGNGKEPMKSRQRSSSESSSEDSDMDNRRHKKAKNDSKNVKEYSRESGNYKRREYVEPRCRSSSPNEVKSFGLTVPKGARKARSDAAETKKKGESSQRCRDRSRDKKRDRSRERDGYSKNSRNTSSRRERSRSRDRNSNKNRYNRPHLSQEEKEKKLKEMMDNVSWRNDLLDKNSKRHKEQLKKEESQPQDFNEDFVRNQISKGIYSDTVEKRIKSNLHNIQRSSFAMDKNFAKR